MSIYDHDDYRLFLQAEIDRVSQGKRGELQRLARAAQVHQSVLSQVFRNQRDLTPEQAHLACGHFSLSEDETNFFLLLVQKARAGTPKLRAFVERQITAHKDKARQLAHRLPVERKLTIEEQAIYYSSWHYSGVRVLSSIEGYHSIPDLAQALSLPRERMSEIVAFLLRHGLCVETDGRIAPGPQSTHLSATSPWILRHHANWRVKALERHPQMEPESELAYSSVVSLSKKQVARVRETLVQAIQDVCKVVDASSPETAYVIGIDWLRLT